jgi:hypothetical protein
MRPAVHGPERPDEIWLGGTRLPLSNQLLEYLGGLAGPLLSNLQLASYLSAAESLRSTDPSLLEAQASIGRLRTAIDQLRDSGEISPDRASTFSTEISRLREVSYRRSGGQQARLERAVTDVERLAKQITQPSMQLGEGGATAGASADDISRLLQALDIVESELRELRRTSNLGAYS